MRNTRKKKEPGYLQQGDVLMKPVGSIPAGAKRLPSRVLREGEHTGHKHLATAEDVVLFEVEGVMYARVPSGSPVVHEEHRTVFMPPGDYRIDAVREYDHFAEEIREVMD